MLFVEALGRPVAVFHIRAEGDGAPGRAALPPERRGRRALRPKCEAWGRTGRSLQSATRRSNEDAAMARHEAGGRPPMAVLWQTARSGRRADLPAPPGGGRSVLSRTRMTPHESALWRTERTRVSGFRVRVLRTRRPGMTICAECIACGDASPSPSPSFFRSPGP